MIRKGDLVFCTETLNRMVQKYEVFKVITMRKNSRGILFLYIHENDSAAYNENLFKRLEDECLKSEN